MKKWWESALPFIKNVKNFELANQFKGATINDIEALMLAVLTSGDLEKKKAEVGPLVRRSVVIKSFLILV